MSDQIQIAKRWSLILNALQSIMQNGRTKNKTKKNSYTLLSDARRPSMVGRMLMAGSDEYLGKCGSS